MSWSNAEGYPCKNCGNLCCEDFCCQDCYDEHNLNNALTDAARKEYDREIRLDALREAKLDADRD